MRVELHRDAQAEIRDAATWYDERRIGLGSEFVSEVMGVLVQIGEAPLLFPPWPGMSMREPMIRRAVVQRFPHLVAFEIHEPHIFVLAIAHAKRRPLYWLERAY